MMMVKKARLDLRLDDELVVRLDEHVAAVGSDRAAVIATAVEGLLDGRMFSKTLLQDVRAAVGERALPARGFVAPPGGIERTMFFSRLHIPMESGTGRPIGEKREPKPKGKRR